MESQSTAFIVIEELPTAELYLLDSAQSSPELLCAGPLQICRIQVSGTFFLAMQPNFTYALSKSIQVLRGKDKRYVLPTNQRGVMYGITVQNPIKAQVHMLDVVLEDNCEFVVHKVTVSDAVASAVSKGGSWLAKGLRRSAELAAVGYSKGKEKVSKMLEDRRERKKQAARAAIEAKSEQPGREMPLPAVSSMLATSEAVAATGVTFAPQAPSAPLAQRAVEARDKVAVAVTGIAASAKQSARTVADRVAQEQLGVRNADDLIAGLRLLSATASVIGKYVDPQTALRVAARAAQVVSQPRPA